MTKLKLLALGVLIATSAGVAHAEGKFSLGAGVGVVEHPYKDYDTDVYPVPVINYEGDNFLVPWLRWWFTTCGMTQRINFQLPLTGRRFTSKRKTVAITKCVTWMTVRAP